MSDKIDIVRLSGQNVDLCVLRTDDEAIESRESEKDSKSYLLPNAVKNQYIKVSPL